MNVSLVMVSGRVSLIIGSQIRADIGAGRHIPAGIVHQ